MKNNPILQSFGHAVLLFIYIAFLAWLMPTLGDIFESMDEEYWAPVIMLLLFTLSAAISGTLVLGRPILLYVSGEKSKALKFFGYTLAWMAIFIILILTIQPWR